MPYKIAPLDWLLFCSLVVIWGSSFAMTKIAVATMAPEWIVALRILIGAILLLAIAALTRQWPGRTLASWKKYLWLGLVGNTVPFFLITWGLHFVSSGISGLLMGTIPILILVLAHFFLPGERLNRYRMAGFALGFAGLLLILDPGKIQNQAEGLDAIKGELAIVLACVCYAIHSISAKRMGFDKPFAQSSAVLLCGGIAAITYALVAAPHGMEHASTGAMWAALGLGLFPTGIATVITYKLMERTSPTLVSQSNYLVPVYSLVFGALLLGESLSWNVLLALVVILAGIFVSRMKSPSRAKA